METVYDLRLKLGQDIQRSIGLGRGVQAVSPLEPIVKDRVDAAGPHRAEIDGHSIRSKKVDRAMNSLTRSHTALLLRVRDLGGVE